MKNENGDHQFEQVFDGDTCPKFDDVLVKVDEDDAIFDIIGHKFMSNMKNNSKSIIEAIYKVDVCKSPRLEAKQEWFNIFSGVTSCMEYAWYCNSKQVIQRILCSGFTCFELDHHHGISLTPCNSLAQSVHNCVADEEGLKHVVLCRVLVESMKEIDHDANSQSGTYYYVWSTNMNTHILPQYVISFKTLSRIHEFTKPRQIRMGREGQLNSNTPLLHISTLIFLASNFLPPHIMSLINKRYKDFQERRISRHIFIRHLQQYAGKDVLIHILKRFGTD